MMMSGGGGEDIVGIKEKQQRQQYQVSGTGDSKDDSFLGMRFPWMTKNEVEVISSIGPFTNRNPDRWKVIDWSVPAYRYSVPGIIDRNVIDRDYRDDNVVMRKFWLVDVASRINKTWHKDFFLSLYDDPTMYMYFFYNIRHRWYQDMICSDRYRFKIMLSSNQLGKSYLLNTTRIYNFLRDHGHGHNGGIISATLDQAKYQMKRIKNILEKGHIDWQDEKGETDNVFMISLRKYSDRKEYKYTNYLIVAPCTAGALGYDFHDLDLDEFDFWEIDTRHAYEQYLEPRTYSTKGNINIYTNPNGKSNYTYQLWNQRLADGSYKWHRYRFNYWDSPGANDTEFKLYCAGKPRTVVESTLLAIFTTAEGALFTDWEVTKSLDPNISPSNMLGKHPFFFLDVGSVHDNSVLTGGYYEQDVKNPDFFHIYIPIIHRYPVGYPISRTVGVQTSDQDSDGWHYEKPVREYIDEWTMDGGVVPTFGVDITGNSGILPLFQTIGIDPVDVTFSGPAKSQMYQRFKYYMEKGLLHRIHDDRWEMECRALEVKRSQRKYWMVHAPDADTRDDCPDSTAGLIHLIDPNTEIQPSFMVI